MNNTKHQNLNKWIKLNSLLRDINKALSEIDDFAKSSNSFFVVKDVSVELPCFLKKDQQDIEVSLPDPSMDFNSEGLTKLKLNGELLPSQFKKQCETCNNTTKNNQEKVMRENSKTTYEKQGGEETTIIINEISKDNSINADYYSSYDYNVDLQKIRL